MIYLNIERAFDTKNIDNMFYVDVVRGLTREEAYHHADVTAISNNSQIWVLTKKEAKRLIKEIERRLW